MIIRAATNKVPLSFITDPRHFARQDIPTHGTKKKKTEHHETSQRKVFD